MARGTSVAALVAVLVLPGAAALTGYLVVPEAPPPKVPAVVRIGESTPPSRAPDAAPTPTPTPTAAPPPTQTVLPPPAPVDDGDDDGDVDDG